MSNNNINWLGNKVVGAGTTTGTTGQYKRTQDMPINQGETYQTQKESEMNVTMPSYTSSQQGPPTVADISYMPGYLMSNIGKNVRAEFYINNFSLDKAGKLVSVGANYFVLEDINSRTNIMCDLYSVRFVTILV